MVTFKESVRIRRLTPALHRILDVLVELDGRPYLGPDLVVTSIHDSQHMAGSRHCTDEAVDVRSKNLAPNDKHLFVEQLQLELGPRFTVLLEDHGGANEHIHIQPKKGTTYP